ncbi:MAG: TagK domain-containing protein [Pseudacidovorax sp.]|nr:TagK domain-containing protein [Pseudacidovorax sp.]
MDGMVEAPPMRLRLTHSHGRVADAHLILEPAGMAVGQMLQRLGEDAADLGSQGDGQLAWQAAAQQWQLSHGGAGLAFTLNGRRMALGETVALRAGDELEIGLVRLVVEYAGIAGVMEEGEPRAWPAVGRQPEPEFDLRDLAGTSVAGPMPVESERAAEDPFSVLGLDAVRSAPAEDPWLALLGLDPGPMGTVSAPPSAAQPSARAAQPGMPLLEQLHEEFVRAVRDPTGLPRPWDWAETSPDQPGQAPSFEALCEEARSFALLRDILQPREDMDRLIDQFPSLGEGDLLAVEGEPDVLRLFAPELVAGLSPAVPDLTRREHHALAADSAVRLGRAINGAGGGAAVPPRGERP